MASSVVVKVKYENKLRRFNAAVNENQQLELDFEGLRAKIRSLFSLTPESELEMTYEDEDDDIVALVDDEDLHDVLNQGLNPVRISVKINTSSAASVKSSGTSTPLPAQDNIYPGIADLLKTMPEPLRVYLSDLAAQVASRTASSAPILGEFVEGITSAADSFLNAHKNEKVNVASASEKNKKGSFYSCAQSDIGSTYIYKTRLVDIFENNHGIHQQEERKAQRKQLASATSSGKETASSEDLQKIYARRLEAAKRKAINKEETAGFAATSEAEMKPFGVTKEEGKRSTTSECPFGGLSMQHAPTMFSKDNIFHRGVQCDGCGVHPITGPRFKSKLKLDYDLCKICFQQIGMGKDSDYIRIDFPAPYRYPWSLKSSPYVSTFVHFYPYSTLLLDIYKLPQPKPWGHPPPPLRFFGKHMKQLKPKLDSRFILDVNVMDGTIMAPNTRFTKIWRMRNNGNLPWIHGTQLVWIGGDKFSPTSSVGIEIPVSGFYPENEVDVAVDFIAPELPGRYISYWKMASSSGQKFGQRVWVLIQVDASFPESSSTLPNTLNLNLPPEGTAENNTPHAVVEPLEDPIDPLDQIDPLMAKQVQQFMLNHQQAYNLNLLNNNLLFNNTHPVSNAGPTQPIPSSSSVTYPRIEEDNTTTKSEVEDALLNELEQMGFKQVEVNKKVLKKNEYDFEKSLDELCNVSEWDLLLEEMRGMGFEDGETNREALKKNNGSLKHAVMDLITRENV
ncbi:uncharacterized protein [Phyllobates terribilis]|uniref:uncharacterized protein n=1 Tax=Phyllobates terribilis TaxID=111132 RepID=UPI003CCB52CD